MKERFAIITLFAEQGFLWQAYYAMGTFMPVWTLNESQNSFREIFLLIILWMSGKRDFRFTVATDLESVKCVVDVMKKNFAAVIRHIHGIIF